MAVIGNPDFTMSLTVNWPDPNAIALGGVDTGRGIAKEQQKAIPINSGEIGSTFNPNMIGMIKLAVAVLLMTEDIMQATVPNITINQ